MADPHDLVRRANMWKDNPAELEKIMANMSTLSEPHVFPVAEAAGALLLQSSRGGRLSEYQSATCNVYTARAYTINESEHALDALRQASIHLASLREALKPLAALGVAEEHHQVKELATQIEELKSIWKLIKPVEPIELPRHVHFGTSSIGQAQWLLDRARGSGDDAWRCVGYLGYSHIWSAKPLWTVKEGPNAAGLLSDPMFKLFNFLNRSRQPGAEVLDSAALWNEVVHCERICSGLDPSLAGDAPVALAVGLEGREDSFFTLETSHTFAGNASNNAGGDA